MWKAVDDTVVDQPDIEYVVPVEFPNFAPDPTSVFLAGKPGPPKLKKTLPFDGCLRAGTRTSWRLIVRLEREPWSNGTVKVPHS
jgi:hypothetical protein